MKIVITARMAPNYSVKRCSSGPDEARQHRVERLPTSCCGRQHRR